MSKVVQKYFKVADHVFSVIVDGSVAGNADFFAQCMDNYAPFVIPGVTAGAIPSQARNQIFTLSVLSSASLDYTEEIRQEDEGQTIICGHTAAGESVFEYLLRDGL